MQQRTSIPHIGISGSYGGINIGDEAILEGIVGQLRESLPVEITVFTRDAEDTLGRHQVDHAVPIRDLSRDEARSVVEQLDVLVLGGGGLLYDRDAEAYLREVNLAHDLGIPVMVYAVSAGPLQDAAARELVQHSLSRVDVMTVRDRKGHRLLEEVGVHRDITITADPALLLTPRPFPAEALKSEGLDPKERLVGFSVREPGPAAPDIDVEHYHTLLANAADFMIERLDARVVFVPMERRKMDLQHSHAVIARMLRADRAVVLQHEYTPGEMISLIGHFDFAVGMRLHFLIFSALAGVPFVALPYASKVTGLIEDLEMEMPPLHDVNSGRLIAAIDRSWDRQNAIRKQIQRRLPDLQERARETNRLLVSLIKQKALAGQTA